MYSVDLPCAHYAGDVTIIQYTSVTMYSVDLPCAHYAGDVTIIQYTSVTMYSVVNRSIKSIEIVYHPLDNFGIGNKFPTLYCQ